MGFSLEQAFSSRPRSFSPSPDASPFFLDGPQRSHGVVAPFRAEVAMAGSFKFLFVPLTLSGGNLANFLRNGSPLNGPPF